ncbi:MAG: UDP-N-acetylglucosamine 2-epimerase, partial [bacterium]|nr:UDP-N-acetylglucosamine 2-epimerase [bacterium]
MRKIVTIIGARPQFIKTPLVSGEIRKFAKEIIVHTGQHYDYNMDKIFFEELGIPKPDYHLGVGSDTQAKQTAKMLEKIEDVLIKEKPDMVLIFGDTNSTVAGALAAAKLHIPVAHVEAGMRSYNREMPEEINRIVSDHISDILFCSTKSSAEILKKEGITEGVYWVGDVMADIQMKIQNHKVNASRQNPNKSQILKELNIKSKEYILATVHRQENTDKKENLDNIL